MVANIIKLFIFQICISFLIIYISNRLKLLDIPNYRKIHSKPVPFTGGLSLGLSFLFIVFITDISDEYLNLILSYSILICLSGLIDDKYQVNPGTKIILQFIPIFFLIDNGLILKSIGNYNYFGELSIGSFDKIFTLFCCMLLINAFNYSDGLDGLLGSISIIIILNFIAFDFIFHKNFVELFYFILISLVIFIFFNFGILKNKFFLGDSGSNLLGYIFAFFAIYLFTFQDIHPTLIIWPLAYIVFEFLSVNMIRILKNNSIFKPGNDHLHYELLKINNVSKLKVLTIICVLNIIFSITGILLNKLLNPDFSLMIYIFVFILYFSIRYKLSSHLKQS